MSFIAAGDPDDLSNAPDGIVTNDGFFPDIDGAQIRKRYRIRRVISADRLREAIINGIITAGNELQAWADSHIAAGHATLADVPGPMIDGEKRLVALYRRAVGCEAAAELVEGYRDTDMTGAGQREVNDLAPSIDELRRNRLYAVRDMLGVGRSKIELI